jgi:hypothetical protein
MSLLVIVSGIISGVAIAYLLNKLLANKLENKNHRIGLKVSAYILCILLGMAFAIIGSLRTILDNFLENRIAYFETRLVEVFPNSDILETGIETNKLTLITSELRQIVDNTDKSGDSYFEKLVFDAFLNKLSGYISAAEDSVNTIAMFGNENGIITARSFLYYLKAMALETITPYFIYGQIGILLLLLIYVGIYFGVVIFLKKGGAMYNKSIVFGTEE